MKKRNRIFALLTALALLLGLLSACGGENTAAVMKLRKARGKVSVSDDAGKSLEAERDLGLYSGYGVKTKSESYAWIDLDAVKLTKLDEDSAVEITKDGGALELNLKSGGLFFNITEPLEEDETLEIRTSSMVVGIRGTCGWVTVSDGGDTMQVWLLEGRVRCEAGDAHKSVTAGETAVLTADGEITVTSFPAEALPAFVWEEIEDDEKLREGIELDSGLSLSQLMPGVVVMPTPVTAEEIAEQLSRPEVTGVIVRLGETGSQNYLTLRDLDAPEKLLYVEDLSFSLYDSTLGRLELKKTPGYSDGLADALRDSTVGSLSLTNCRASLYGCTTGDIQVQGGGSLALEWYNTSNRSCVTGDIRFDGSLLRIEHSSITGDIAMLSGELRVDNTCTTGAVTYPNGEGPETDPGAAPEPPGQTASQPVRIEHYNRVFRIVYTYDQGNLVLKETYALSDDSLISREEYFYDPDPQENRIRYSYTTGESEQDYYEDRFYDDQGRLSRDDRFYPDGNWTWSTNYTYGNGGASRDGVRTFPDGSQTTTQQDVTDLQPEMTLKNGYPDISTTRTYKNPGEKVYTCQEEFDGQGRLIRREHCLDGRLDSYLTHEYDGQGRLVRSEFYNASGTQQYYLIYEYD